MPRRTFHANSSPDSPSPAVQRNSSKRKAPDTPPEPTQKRARPSGIRKSTPRSSLKKQPSSPSPSSSAAANSSGTAGKSAAELALETQYLKDHPTVTRGSKAFKRLFDEDYRKMDNARVNEGKKERKHFVDTGKILHPNKYIECAECRDDKKRELLNYGGKPENTRRHFTARHKDNTGVVLPDACYECYLIFRNKIELERHVEEEHQDEVEGVEDEDVSGLGATLPDENTLSETDEDAPTHDGEEFDDDPVENPQSDEEPLTTHSPDELGNPQNDHTFKRQSRVQSINTVPRLREPASPSAQLSILPSPVLKIPTTYRGRIAYGGKLYRLADIFRADSSDALLLSLEPDKLGIDSSPVGSIEDSLLATGAVSQQIEEDEEEDFS